MLSWFYVHWGYYHKRQIIKCLYSDREESNETLSWCCNVMNNQLKIIPPTEAYLILLPNLKAQLLTNDNNFYCSFNLFLWGVWDKKSLQPPSLPISRPWNTEVADLSTVVSHNKTKKKAKIHLSEEAKYKRGTLVKIKIFIYISYTTMKHSELNKINELKLCLLFLH